MILESERHIGNNPFDFLSKNVIPDGSFVSIGYVNDHEISWGPRTRKSINPTNDAKLTEYIEKLPEGTFKKALVDFQNSAKYQAALASGKTAPFNIEGEVHIIKIGRFTVNWKSNEAFAKFYKDRNDEVTRIRSKYGFGDPEKDYAEDDWRQKYGGTGLYPVSKHRGNQGNPYKPLAGNIGFYSHIDDPGKLSIRQISNPRASKVSLWLFVDADGTVTYLDNEVMAWLTYAYKGTKAKEEVKEIVQEEKDFIAEIESIKNYGKTEMTMPLDNILYLTGTTVDAEKNKESFTWLNDDKISELYPYINREELDSIIRKCVKISSKETEQMNEGLQIKLKKYLNESKPNKGNLYESIMTRITPKIQEIFEEFAEDLIPENDQNAHEEEVKAAVKICVEDIQNNGGTYLDWGETGTMYQNVNSREIAEEVARKFKNKGYFVYYDLMGMGNSRIAPGTEVCIRIEKRAKVLDPKKNSEFI